MFDPRALILVLSISTACAPQTDEEAAKAAGPRNFQLTDGDEEQIERIEFDVNGSTERLLSSTQLSNKIKHCLGEEMVLVHVESLVAPIGATPNPNGFLLSVNHPVGSNITTTLNENFDGKRYLLGSTTRNTALNLNYLSSLEAVGNVVGHNCEIIRARDSDPSICECESEAAAGAMLNRCLPLFKRNQQFESIKVAFQEKCVDDLKGAIASMVASLSFATEP